MKSPHFFPPTLNPTRDRDVREAMGERTAIVAEQGILMNALDDVAVTDERSLATFFEHLESELSLLNRAVVAQAHLIAAMREFWNEERRAALATLTPEQLRAQTENPVMAFLRGLAEKHGIPVTDGPAKPSALTPEQRAALKDEVAKIKAEVPDGEIPALAIVKTPDGKTVVVDSDGNEAPSWMESLAYAMRSNGEGTDTGNGGFGGFGGMSGNGTLH